MQTESLCRLLCLKYIRIFYREGIFRNRFCEMKCSVKKYSHNVRYGVNLKIPYILIWHTARNLEGKLIKHLSINLQFLRIIQREKWHLCFCNEIVLINRYSVNIALRQDKWPFSQSVTSAKCFRFYCTVV